MTEKRWKIIDEEFISYTGGNAIIISNGDFKFAIWEIKEDVQKICNKLNKLVDENKELKERNKRQCKRLDDLYQLIEQKDWRALSDIMYDFKKAEEQLQKEWRTYGD